MRKLLFATTCLLVSGIASACPDIRGTWAIFYDETVSGDTGAGIGRVIFSGQTFFLEGFEGYLGEKFPGKGRGRYSVNSKCFVTINYTIDDTPYTGNIKGIIVNPDRMFMMGNSDAGLTFRIEAERMSE